VGGNWWKKETHYGPKEYMDERKKGLLDISASSKKGGVGLYDFTCQPFIICRTEKDIKTRSSVQWLMYREMSCICAYD